MLQRLQNWPTDVNINWTQIANEHNMKGTNRGQIVKEFAAENRFDVQKLDGRPVGTRTRRRKLRIQAERFLSPLIAQQKALMKTGLQSSVRENSHLGNLAVLLE